MVTSIFTSKYTVMAFTVLGLSIVLSLALLFLTTPSVAESKSWDSPQPFLIVFAAIAIVVFGCLPLLRMKIIRIEVHQITFQKYAFGSNMRKINLKDLDHYQTINEETENGYFESIWLIKEGKLVDSFSSYQYANYEELKSALNLEYKGILDLSPIKQLLCRFGSKIFSLSD